MVAVERVVRELPVLEHALRAAQLVFACRLQHGRVAAAALEPRNLASRALEIAQKLRRRRRARRGDGSGGKLARRRSRRRRRGRGRGRRRQSSRGSGSGACAALAVEPRPRQRFGRDLRLAAARLARRGPSARTARRAAQLVDFSGELQILGRYLAVAPPLLLHLALQLRVRPLQRRRLGSQLVQCVLPPLRRGGEAAHGGEDAASHFLRELELLLAQLELLAQRRSARLHSFRRLGPSRATPHHHAPTPAQRLDLRQRVAAALTKQRARQLPVALAQLL